DCSENTIKGNLVLSNDYGIYLFGCSNNLIFKNYLIDNFINNSFDNSINQWDNGTLGNYWDDYQGSDLDDDGIGDTPYIIPGMGGRQDNYPIWDDGVETPLRLIDEVISMVDESLKYIN
ncbi:unnamed protein product, partial [marine sediment metagenome]